MDNCRTEAQYNVAVCCVCSPESRQGSPNPRGDGPMLEALAQLASPASSRPQTVGGRSQTSALAQLADVESSSWGPKGGSQAHSKYGSFSADLDFDEFLERQQRFLQVCVCVRACVRACVCVCVYVIQASQSMGARNTACAMFNASVC